MPGKHHGGKRPVGHGGQQPEPAQGGGARPDRGEGSARLRRPDYGQEGGGRPGRAEHGGCFEVHGLGRVLEGLHDPDRVYREEVRGSVRALGIDPGPFRSHAIPVLPGQGMCRKGAGRHPRWGGTLLYYVGSGYVRNDR